MILGEGHDWMGRIIGYCFIHSASSWSCSAFRPSIQHSISFIFSLVNDGCMVFIYLSLSKYFTQLIPSFACIHLSGPIGYYVSPKPYKRVGEKFTSPYYYRMTCLLFIYLLYFLFFLFFFLVAASADNGRLLTIALQSSGDPWFLFFFEISDQAIGVCSHSSAMAPWTIGFRPSWLNALVLTWME